MPLILKSLVLCDMVYRKPILRQIDKGHNEELWWRYFGNQGDPSSSVRCLSILVCCITFNILCLAVGTCFIVRKVENMPYIGLFLEMVQKQFPRPMDDMLNQQVLNNNMQTDHCKAVTGDTKFHYITMNQLLTPDINLINLCGCYFNQLLTPDIIIVGW